MKKFDRLCHSISETLIQIKPSLEFDMHRPEIYSLEGELQKLGLKQSINSTPNNVTLRYVSPNLKSKIEYFRYSLSKDSFEIGYEIGNERYKEKAFGYDRTDEALKFVKDLMFELGKR